MKRELTFPYGKEKVTYTFDDGSSDTVVICKDLMDTFTKYTKG